MRVTPLPIPEFLRLSVEAAETRRYAGVAVAIDRIADRTSKLLEDLVRERVSLDSVTDHEVLVVVPAAPGWPRGGSDESGVADRERKWDVYTAIGLSLPVGVGVLFREAFWDAAGHPESWGKSEQDRDAALVFSEADARRPQTSADAAERDFSVSYILDEDTAGRLAADITRSSTATARFSASAKSTCLAFAF